MRTLVHLSFFLLLISCSTKKEKEVEKTPSKEEMEFRATESFRLPQLPDYVVFCKDTLKLDDFDIRERLDKELIVNTFYHSATIQGFKRANRYFPVISKILKKNKVPDDMKYLCLIESNLTQAVSPSGAKGFWQFIPATGKEFNLKINNEVDERLDVRKSTQAAADYLNGAYEKFGDWYLASASYNCGLGGISNAIEQQGTSNYFDLYLNAETSRYIFRILAMKMIYEDPKAYGFDPKNLELYDEVPTRQIQVAKSIPDLIKWSLENGSNYRKLKVLNPWILSNKLTVVNDTLIIELPLE